MRIGDLAQIERVEPPTMTRLVDAMERDGHVVRSPDPADRRAVLVRATPRGYPGDAPCTRTAHRGALAGTARC